MATIQLPALPEIPGSPAAGDILLIRSSGVDYKIDFDDLVEAREDTINIWTASNTFTTDTSFSGDINVDVINADATSTVIISDTLQADTIEGSAGTVTVDSTLMVNVDLTVQDDLNVVDNVYITDDLYINGTKLFDGSTDIKAGFLPTGSTTVLGITRLATESDMRNVTSSDAVTPWSMSQAATYMTLRQTYGDGSKQYCGSQQFGWLKFNFGYIEFSAGDKDNTTYSIALNDQYLTTNQYSITTGDHTNDPSHADNDNIMVATTSYGNFSIHCRREGSNWRTSKFYFSCIGF